MMEADGGDDDVFQEMARAGKFVIMTIDDVDFFSLRQPSSS